MADRYYKFVVNGREYVEGLPESAGAPQGHVPISEQEFQLRLPYNQMEEQQFRKAVATGQLPFQTPYPQSQGEISDYQQRGSPIYQNPLNQYGLKLIKVGNNYQLYESGGFNQQPGIRDIPANLAQNLINQGLQPIDSSTIPGFNTGEAFPGQATGKKNITQQSELDQLLSNYAQNSQLQQFGTPLNLAKEVQQALSRGESAESIKQRFGLSGEEFGRLSAPDISGNYYGAPGVTPGTPAPGGPPLAPGQPGTQQPGEMTGKIITGNPQADEFLNNVWIPLIEAEFGDNPIDIANPELWKKIVDKVEAQYGAAFKNELDNVKQTHDRNVAEINATKSALERKYGTDATQGIDLTRGLEDINAMRADLQARQQQIERQYGTATTQGTELERGLQDIETAEARASESAKTGIQRGEEDKLRLLADSARNFEEHTQQSQESFRRRGLIFSGIQAEQQRKLQEQDARQQALIEQQSLRSKQDFELEKIRTLENLKTQRERLQSDVPFQREQLSGEMQRRLDEQKRAEERLRSDISFEGEQQLGTVGRQLGEQEQTYQQQQDQIEDARRAEQAREVENLRNLGLDIRQNPETYRELPTSPAATATVKPPAQSSIAIGGEMRKFPNIESPIDTGNPINRAPFAVPQRGTVPPRRKLPIDPIRRFPGLPINPNEPRRFLKRILPSV